MSALDGAAANHRGGPASMLQSRRFDTYAQSPTSTPSAPRRRPQKMSPYTSPPHANADLMAFSTAIARPREPTARLASPHSQAVASSNGDDGIVAHPYAAPPSSDTLQAQIGGSAGRPVGSVVAPVSGLQVPGTAAAAVPPLGSELFDAIVQAADPRHPDHAAWQERYGSLASRSSRNSASSQSKRERVEQQRTGASPVPSRASQDQGRTDAAEPSRRKRDSLKSVRRGRPAVSQHAGLRDSDAEDSSEPSDGLAHGGEAPGACRIGRIGTSEHGSSPRLARSSSGGSAAKARRRRRPTDKGKMRAPPLPIPPPRVTSSTRWQATYGSPAPDQQQPWQPEPTPPLPPPHPASTSVVGSAQPALLEGGRRLASKPPAALPGPQLPSGPHALSERHRQAQRNTRPLPPLPTEHVSSPTSRTFAVSAGKPASFADPASPSSISYSHHAASASLGHSNNSSVSVPGSSSFHTPATAATWNEAGLNSPTSAGDSDRRPRGRTKTLEKGFFSLPRSMFNHKPSQRSLDADARSPTLSPPSPMVPSRPSYDAGSGRLKSVSKIQQIFGNEVVQPEPTSGPGSARKTSMQVPRVPVPSLHAPNDPQRARQRSMDVVRTLDQRVFPMRGDEEFRSNEFEMSDSEDGMDVEPGASFLPTSFASSPAARPSPRPGSRAPGVVRRSLDSIISPFRAGLVSNSKSNRSAGPLESVGPIHGPKSPDVGRQSMDTAREGRRSMSESRLVRPFLRQRPTKAGGRPLSRVTDGPEPAGDEVLPPAKTRGHGDYGVIDSDNEDGHEWRAQHYDPRSSTLVDPGHAAGPNGHRSDAAPTPRPTFAEAFSGDAGATGGVQRRGHERLLPAAELNERRTEHRRLGAEPSAAMHSRSATSLREAAMGDESTLRSASRQAPRHLKASREETRMPSSPAIPNGFTDLSSEDKKKILAQNTYFLPTRESRSRPPSANGSSNAHGNGAPNSESQHSGLLHGSLASASSCRSLASSYTQSTSAVHMATPHSTNELSFDSLSKQSATPTSQSRGRFAGLFSRVKGTLTPGKTPPSTSLSSFNSPVSTNIMTPSQSVEAGFSHSARLPQADRFENRSGDPSPPLGSGVNGSPAGLGFRYEAEEAKGSKKKQDFPRRLRAKSLASGRKKGKSPGLDGPENFETFISTMRPGEKISTLDEDWRRKLLSEAVDLSFGNRPLQPTPPVRSPSSQDLEHAAAVVVPQSPSAAETSPAPPSDGQAPEQGPRSLGKLLRKKKTAENLDELIQSFVATPPKMSHLDVAEEGAPRPSMSSVRGFDVADPDEGLRVAGSSAPLTIRKTLSPALLSDTVDARRDSMLEAGSDDGRASPRADDADDFAEVLQSTTNSPKVDDTEVLAERDDDRDAVQAPMRRFIRRHASIDRLSRVDETSVKDSLSNDSTDSSSARPSLSVPVSPLPRSFGEHRQIRRSISGTLQPPTVPRALELGGATPGRYEYGKRSMDVGRPRNLDQLVLGAMQPQPFPSEASPLPSPTVQFQETKSPRKMSFGDSLSPAWSRPSFNIQRSGRTSFSQDRDRAPVASPISPPKNYGSKSPALVQAMKKLRVPGKRSKSFSKGIGPGDVIIPDFDDYDFDEYDDGGAFEGSRPSMNLARPSMSGSRPSMSGARPSMSGVRPSMNLARPSVNLERKSFDTSSAGAGRSSLASAEMMTRLLQVHTDAMVATPLTATFPHEASEMPGSASAADAGMASETDASVHTAAEYSADSMVGLGIGTLAELPNASRPSLSASTSNGDLRGLRIADGHGNNLLKTPDAASLNGNGFVYVPKTPELMAFEDMLGRFGQREKELLKDISSRVGTTPAQTPGLGHGDGQKDYDFGALAKAKTEAASSGSGSTTSSKKAAGDDLNHHAP
ncbi:uncharacterized protein PFL1_00763 [Pseudozyma flocculosa PF-1]|uniref:Uncharacterized protein n=1 Tax=Pseudozyma flocculosa TaxID=84751 RepID=A0A5C3F3W1_9BASI|nr:uncharacterized protein PFL1_00763 [Pseudozyma flocculosa PF-1]EPQ31428.1 hypothetical protein PFL1_00763 [Pseudozyma flocculosa PF-1]SPO38790.1 uncharacterized protein PSFLO_04269 [Pseudozyma flocculosa]